MDTIVAVAGTSKQSVERMAHGAEQGVEPNCIRLETAKGVEGRERRPCGTVYKVQGV